MWNYVSGKGRNNQHFHQTEDEYEDLDRDIIDYGWQPNAAHSVKKSFLNWQGYNTKYTILYQYNKITILLEKNGKKSISKRTNHIAIRSYFITNRVKSDEFIIEYCPTGDMVEDYFKKPLQGKKFYQFRKEIMNLKDSIR